MGKVFILDGNQRSSLAVVRSLGKRGIDITVGDFIYPNLSAASRFCKRSIIYPSPYEDVEGFLRAIINEIRTEAYDVILPMTDVTIPITLKNREEIQKYIRLPFVPYPAYELVSDKCKLFKYAQERHIPMPHTVFFASAEKLGDVPYRLNYPVVIKPGKSKLAINGEIVSTGVSYAQSSEEFFQKIHDNGFFNHTPFMVQEKIIGEGVGLFALYRDGKPKILFSHRRLREKPPSGGVSVLCESTPIDPLVREYALRILDDLNWHGVAMVEFKRNSKDGMPYLMEINARFWGSLQLAIDSGIDFPYQLYRTAMGEQIEENFSVYKVGHRCKWILGNLDHFYILLRDRKYKEIKNSLLANCQIGASRFVLRKEDPAPFWIELKQYFKNLIGYETT